MHRVPVHASWRERVRPPAGAARLFTVDERDPMSRIRVLTIIPGLAVGGAERQLVGTLTRLNPDLFDLTVCHYSPADTPLVGQLESAGVRTVFFDKFSMPVWGFFRRLRQTVREIAPHIVHTWLYSANFWGRWAAVSCGVKHIVASDRGFVASPHSVNRVSERLLASRSMRLANSRAAARHVEQSFGLSTGDVRVIYNAVQIPDDSPQAGHRAIREALGLSPDEHIVLMVARQDPLKNFPMFIRTAGRVCRSRRGVTFVCIGRCTAPDELSALAAREGIPGRLLFVGHRDDVNRWLSAADVHCLTSWSEGFPNAILEAMAAGLPVITTAFPGVEELIESPSVGEVVPLDDDGALAERIEALLDDPERRASLGTAARELVSRRFTWNAVVAEMERLYCEMVGRAAPDSALRPG